MSIFGSEKIIEKLSPNNNLNVYYAGFDLEEFRYNDLVKQIQSVIVDFAYGYHEGILENSYGINVLRESAKSIYKIEGFEEAKQKYVDEDSEFEDDIADKFLKRGEFGELILHLLLRDFHESVPLLSKIYFKDADGVTVHGFDAVHIAPDLNDPDQNSLWLGESKLYADGKKGVKELTKDITEHFNKEYLKREFALISKKENSYIALDKFADQNKIDEYEAYIKEKEYWYELIDEKNKLQDILTSVTIPMVCTYTSKVFNDHNDENTQGFKDDLQQEITELKEYFDKHLKMPLPIELNILLLLFPVPSKKELVKKMHLKLNHTQNI